MDLNYDLSISCYCNLPDSAIFEILEFKIFTQSLFPSVFLTTSPTIS